jgi:polar amino acid transport system substrate-binding protein
MQQLTQLLKDGTMELTEVPFPALQQGTVLVRNYYSVISAGTEGKTVKDARLGYIGKAKARKEEVKKVIQTAKTLGLVKTYQLVMNKLESPSPLGYSSAGKVIAVAPDVTTFKVGDFVACGGATANHAEVVAVPKNLCVKLPNAAKIKEASFTTIAAIAMQGIRQANVQLGETVVVIGLGLVGQITMQLLKAAGVTAIGTDIDQNAVDLAKNCGFELVYNRNTADLDKIIFEKTNQYGADSVIITAATSSNDPVEFAGIIARQKAKVVIVGAVPTGFSRKNYYRKELDLRMSCSYGPGRYDDNYEQKGVDYPIGYVRWTENRNMQAFVDLLYNDKLNLQPIITHHFKFEKAKDAYQIIVNKSEPFCGIVLEYDTKKELTKTVNIKPVLSKSNINIGFIGAGSFAQNFLLPSLLKINNITLDSVATAKPQNAKKVAEKFNFHQAVSSANDIISNPDINVVFIATRHNLHATYVIEALKNDKIVFVEKPLALTPQELNQIIEAEKNSKGSVMVGFNRRFAPLTQQALQFIGSNLPVAVNYRINAGQVPADHWVHDPEIGGGRIIGEACHFIDYCRFFAKSEITHIKGNFMVNGNIKDTAAISIGFANGSIATISYFSNGSKLLPKEQIEIFSGSRTAVINDFKTLTNYDTKVKQIKSNSQDKGHFNELVAFIEAVRNGKALPVPFSEIVEVTEKTFDLLSV